MKDSKGYSRYKGALGGMYVSLILTFVIGFGLFRDRDLKIPFLLLILLVLVSGGTLGAFFPKFFTWAYNILPDPTAPNHTDGE